MINLHILCGIPASGKSTWARQQNGKIISRDEIRKNCVGENPGKNYFNKEKQVYKEMIATIKTAIKENVENIYVDATHVDVFSRAKLLNNFSGLENKNNINLTFDYFPILLDIALKRNSKRKGFAKVPEEAIKNFYFKSSIPSKDEMNKYFNWGFHNVNTILHYTEEV